MEQQAKDCGWIGRHAYAHRGLHGDGCPENSLAAFRAAIAAGLGIECDLRKAADGRAMVFHDADLARLTEESGLLADRSVGELTAIPLRGSRETIPTLRDILALVGGKVPLLLELKTERERPVGPLCRAVRRDCEGYGGAVAVMSFDPRVARWFARHGSSFPLGLVVSEEGRPTLMAQIKRRLAVELAKPDFLALDVRDLPSGLSRRQIARKAPLVSWTVDSPAKLDAALEAGAMPILEGAGVVAFQSRT
ncbi:glycerophosphodiester phosphodiesterase family protein [Aurantiacibacter suaedae]|uniref:glycerophosphodiester phosphodiesterase family protein n=1 Tax=Aurantiacibacter suaedae TaxID=2545755 RepID=UPI0010F5DE7F|nr:glycerophosphodiester phosphodiesterase family protein [Aurantiacibacter suaedae]